MFDELKKSIIKFKHKFLDTKSKEQYNHLEVSLNNKKQNVHNDFYKY